MIKEIKRHIEKELQTDDKVLFEHAETVEAKKSLLTEVCNQWSQICSKVALDFFNRPFILTLAPELLTAILLYVSETYVMRLKLFNQNKHSLNVHIQTVSAVGGISNTESSKTKASSLNANSTIGDGHRVSPTFTVNSGSTSKGNICHMTGQQVLTKEIGIHFNT